MAKQRKQQSGNTTSVQTNTFIKGLNKDSDPSFVQQGMWTHARNASNNTSSGDLGTISNEESNALCAQAMYAVTGENKDIIGTIHLFSDKWVIYSVQYTELDGRPLNSEIGLFEEDTCTYRVIVNDKCLNFDKLYLITGASRLLDDCSWQVYWADNLNPDRYMNIGDPKLWIDEPFTYLNGQPGSTTVNYYTDGTDQVLWPGVAWEETCVTLDNDLPTTPEQDSGCIVCSPTNKLDCDKLRLARLVKTPSSNIKRGEQPGSLGNGSYAVAIAYTIDQVRVTNYFSVGYPQPIYYDPDLRGSLDIDVDVDENAFDEFELVVIRFTNQNEDARSIGYYSTQTKRVIVDLFTDQNPRIDKTTILLQDYVFEKSEQILAANNYLLRIGPTSKFDFNYQPLANLIEAEWLSIEYDEKYYTDGGKNAGYLRDEIYAFFIRWVYDTGDKSASYHIPGRPPGTYVTPEGVVTTDIAELNDQNSVGTTPLYEDNQIFHVLNTATQTSTTIEPLDDGGQIIANGKMGYWQSTEKYPDRHPEVWNSTAHCWTGVNSDDNRYDLCGQPIRHHRFPDNALTESTYHFKKNSDGQFKIRLMGVRFNNIIMPKDNDGNDIPNIVGYEILRGSRNGNKTILAKGMINNFRNYSIQGTPRPLGNNDVPGLVGLYANYPYNCLIPRANCTVGTCAPPVNTADYLYNDPFIVRRAVDSDLGGVSDSDENGGSKLYKRLPQNIPVDIQSFHSPDTSYNNPTLSASELKVYGWLKGTATQQFIEPEKHPEFKLLGNEVVLFAVLGGIINMILNMVSELNINYPSKNYTIPRFAEREFERERNNWTLTPGTDGWTLTGAGDQSAAAVTNDEDFAGTDHEAEVAEGLNTGEVTNPTTGQPYPPGANAAWQEALDNAVNASIADFFTGNSAAAQALLNGEDPLPDANETLREKYEQNAGNYTTPGYNKKYTGYQLLPSFLEGATNLIPGITLLQQSFFYFAEGAKDTVDVLYSIVRTRQYALQQIGYGEYTSFNPHRGAPNEFDHSSADRFRLPVGTYVRDQLTQLPTYQVTNYDYSLPGDGHTGEVTYRINNLLRPDLVVVRTTDDNENPSGPHFLINNPGVFSGGDQSVDQSSMTLGLLQKTPGYGWELLDNENAFKDRNKSNEFRNVIASHYVGLKFTFRNLYRQLGSIVQVMTTPHEQRIKFIENSLEPNTIQVSSIPFVCNSITFTHTKIKTTPAFFGGDTYVTRHTEKTIMPFFYDWLYDKPDNFRFNYFRKQMIPEPRFMVNSNRWDFSDFNIDNFINAFTPGAPDQGEGLLPRSYYDLDTLSYTEATNTVITYPGLIGVKNAYFYTSSSGIKDFFVESEVITDWRFKGRSAEEKSFNKWLFTDLQQLFSQNPAIFTKGNYFRYDYSLSASRFLFSQYYNNGALQGSNYDPNVSELCYTSFPNRIQYSNVLSEHEAYDAWQMFLALNKVDFKSNLNTIKTFGKTGLLVTFKNNSPLVFQGVDQRETYLGVKATIGDGGLFSTTPQNVVVSDQEYQYGSSQDRYSVISTPAGIYFISQEQGKIFAYTGKLEEISQSGMKWWFDKFLPFKLIEEFPDYPYTDNPVAGIGCSATYDNSNSILYFSKRDFMIKEEYKGNLDFDPDTNRFKLRDEYRYTIKLGDSRFFKDASWTVSYDPKNKLWISFHDWNPGLYMASKTHFLTTQKDGIWKHNSACNDYCNFYGEQYPFEIEIPVPTGQNVTTMRSVEYVLECYRKDSILCSDQFHVLDYNFNKAVISNSEQTSGILNLNIFPKNNVALSQTYPKLGTDLASFDVLFSKEENKYRFNQFWDITKDRGEFPQGSSYPPTGPLVPGTTELLGNYSQNNIWITEPNGYVKNLNDFNLDYTKPLLQRKKFRHYLNFIKFIREDSRDTNMILKIINTKSQASPR